MGPLSETVETNEVVYRTTCDLSDPNQPTMEIVYALSALENRSPLELEPLYDAINTDALNRLFGPDERRDADQLVEFIARERVVAVDGSGEITIRTIA